jgi:3-isopropylmalate/(R)-2-methylmalate dehydratase large subunit
MTAPLSLAQKILAHASGRTGAAPGETVHCRVDTVLLDEGCTDGTLPADLLRAWLRDGTPASDVAERVVLTLAAGSALAGDATPGTPASVYRGLGLGPMVLAQAGRLRPGSLVVSGDAHAAVGGAFGALMLGLDPIRLRAALCHGELPLRVPPTQFVRWIGHLPDGVSAHDMVLRTHARLGPRGAEGSVLEHGGEAVAALSMGERMTLAAMSASLGACAGVLAPDRCTARWLQQADVTIGDDDLAAWRSDEDAPGLRHVLDASLLAPHVGMNTPGSDPSPSPWQPRVLDELEPTRIDVACLGGVEGAKLDDLRAAARVLAGYRIAAGVQLLVAPASRLDREQAAREGILRRLVEAGAILLPDAKLPRNALADSTVIATCTRPFQRAAGDAGTVAPVLRASPFTVAASALRGRLSDARDLLV